GVTCARFRRCSATPTWRPRRCTRTCPASEFARCTSRRIPARWPANRPCENRGMPELPEVETIRRQLEPAITGLRIESAEVLDERWTRPVPPATVERALAGCRIEAVERRGKYLLLRLEGDRTLAMHLRMTGNLLLDRPNEARAAVKLGGRRLYETAPRPRHLRAVIRLEGGARLLFTDARRFGQAVVLRSGGASVDDYLDARGEPGAMQDEFLVHTREGEPCPRCGAEIRRIVVAGRSTYFCPSCQRRLRRRPRRRRRRASAA